MEPEDEVVEDRVEDLYGGETCGESATEEEKLVVESMPEGYGQDEYDAEWGAS